MHPTGDHGFSSDERRNRTSVGTEPLNIDVKANKYATYCTTEADSYSSKNLHRGRSAVLKE